MATQLLHRGTRIHSLTRDDDMSELCRPGDIAIVADAAGWWTYFFADDGSIDKYDIPFMSYNEAIWSAKAAAEFSGE